MNFSWRKLPLGLSLATALALCLLLALGSWQLARLKWKTDLMRTMAAREASIPMHVSQVLEQKDAAWQPVILRDCVVDSHSMVTMHSSLDGKMGYRWLSACASDGHFFLLDLGFSEAREPQFITVKQQIIGHLRPFDPKDAFAPVNNLKKRDFYWREPRGLQEALGAPIRDDYFVVVDLEGSRLSLPKLQQAPISAPMVNRHLEYALTWYGLALSLLGVYVGVVIKTMKAKIAHDQ